MTNKYPVLAGQDYARGDVQPSADAGIDDDIFRRISGAGRHEVVIETPRHEVRLEELGISAIADVLKTFIFRAREMKKNPAVKYVMIFKNHGRNAGASLSHPHSQIIAMPLVPIRVAEEINGAEQYMAKKGRCVFCQMIKEEISFKKRVIAENRSFLAIEPYASRFSFETWILPKKHQSHFENMPASQVRDLALAVKDVLGKLQASLLGLSYNLIIHTMPVRKPEAAHYHWHIEIMPKLSLVAGFEWGTGFYINTVSPEHAARVLNGARKYEI